MYGRENLRWDGNDLYLGRSSNLLCSVVPDERYAGMWRVKYTDGRMSDMVNLSRARDAAISSSLSKLNSRETGAGTAPMRLNPERVPEATQAA